MLLVLNLVDGLPRLAKRRRLLLRCAAILVCVVQSARRTQVVIYFRSAA